MKAILFASVLLASCAANAQIQRLNDDFSLKHESGPPVAPGGGATVGPNPKNMATSPMPGTELGERPRETTMPVPETSIVVPRPAPRAPAGTK